jgi:hypothetical protein
VKRPLRWLLGILVVLVPGGVVAYVLEIRHAEEVLERSYERAKEEARLVARFRQIDAAVGLDSPEGRKQAAATDAALRKLDGFMEQPWLEPRRIAPDSDPAFVRQIALRWTNWWLQERWRTDPRSPVEEDGD